MLEVGWSEILVIALILIIVVGPKDLPAMLRTFGRMATRLRGMANEFKGQFDEALREADLDDVRKGLSEVNKLNPTNTLRDAMNPIRQLGQDIKSDLKKASDMIEKPVTPMAGDEKAADGTTGADPAVAPLGGPVAAASVEKSVEPAAPAQPFVPNVVETPDKPKTSSKKAPVADAAADVAVAAKPAIRKPSVSKQAAAVAAVAAETAAKKPATRKKPVAAAAAEQASAQESGRKKASPRAKTAKAGDA